MPTLLLVGADDRVGDIADGSREWAARDPMVEHVLIPGAGHASNQDNPPAFTAALQAFLDRVLPAARPRPAGAAACGSCSGAGDGRLRPPLRTGRPPPDDQLIGG